MARGRNKDPVHPFSNECIHSSVVIVANLPLHQGSDFHALIYWISEFKQPTHISQQVLAHLVISVTCN